VGGIRIKAIQQYLNKQSYHHGYASRPLPPVFRHRAHVPVTLRAAHCSFELNYHLVLVTFNRRGIFNSERGQALGTYWLKVAAKHRFAIDQISILPDRSHLMVRTIPTMSVESCAFVLMNNGQYFLSRHFPEILVQQKIDRLWQPSAYAGTCGKITTALLKKYLDQDQSVG
jgi:REP element-mobilizing transposase RayT